MDTGLPMVGSQKRLVLKDGPGIPFTPTGTQDGPLKQKLQAHLAEHGTLSSADVANFAQTEEKPLDETILKPTELTVDSKTSRDPLMAQAGKDSASHLDSVVPAEKRKTVVITPEEKDAFIDALVHNKRFSLPFSFYGGRLRIVVRSRTVRESQAIIAAERADMDAKRIVTQMDYTMRLRAMLMTMQIAEFNEVIQLSPEDPLLPTVQADGSITQPAWTNRIDFWLEQGEAMMTTLWQAIEEFETKYWRMVEDSRDSNFWNPAASSSV